jgi:hypothetical protein
MLERKYLLKPNLAVIFFTFKNSCFKKQKLSLQHFEDPFSPRAVVLNLFKLAAR